MRRLIMAIGLLALGCSDDGATPMPDVGTDAVPACYPPTAELHEITSFEVSGDCGPLASAVWPLRDGGSDGICTVSAPLEPVACSLSLRIDCESESGNGVQLRGLLVAQPGDQWAGRVQFTGITPDGTIDCQSEYDATAAPL